jgi:hypothetical protein
LRAGLLSPGEPVAYGGLLPPGGVDSSIPLLLVECGDFSRLSAHYPGLRARTHLAALAQMGAVCAALGPAELALSADDAAEAFADAPLPVLAANVEARLDGVEVARTVTPVPGWAVTAVAAWQEQAGAEPRDWWSLGDPVAAVEDVLTSLPEDTHLIVSALGVPSEDIARLAMLPVALIIGDTRTGELPDPAARIEPEPPARGVRLKLLTLEPLPVDGGMRSFVYSAQPWEVDLTERFDPPEGSATVELLEQFQEEARGRWAEASAGNWQDTEWGMSGDYLPGEKPDYPYVGPDACMECHADAYTEWAKSRHALGLLSLRESGDEQVLECLQCHVTALMVPGGYDPLRPREALGYVGCENCHGPGRDHIRIMRGEEPLAEVEAPGIARGSITSCLECHDEFNSPEFDAPEYWEEIAH